MGKVIDIRVAILAKMLRDPVAFGDMLVRHNPGKSVSIEKMLDQLGYKLPPSKPEGA